MEKAELTDVSALSKKLDEMEAGTELYVRVDGVVKSVEKSLVESGIGENSAIKSESGEPRC